MACFEAAAWEPPLYYEAPHHRCDNILLRHHLAFTSVLLACNSLRGARAREELLADKPSRFNPASFDRTAPPTSLLTRCGALLVSESRSDAKAAALPCRT